MILTSDGLIMIGKTFPWQLTSFILLVSLILISIYDLSLITICNMLFFGVISKSFLRFIDSFIKDYESHIVSRAVIFNLVYFLLLSIFAFLFLI